MLGFGAIATTAISALPDSILGQMSVSFSMTVTFNGVMYDPYLAFVRSPFNRRMYAVEWVVRAVV